MDPFYQSREWKQLRYEVLRERGRRCECCGAVPSKENGLQVNVDHIRSRKNYKHLELAKDNLQVLCSDCNTGKGSRFEDDFRRSDEGFMTLSEFERRKRLSRLILPLGFVLDPPPRDTRKPQGRWQQLVFDILSERRYASGMPVAVLIDEVCAAVPVDQDNPGRDNRRSLANGALQGLVSKKIAFLHPDNRVALHESPTTEEWL